MLFLSAPTLLSWVELDKIMPVDLLYNSWMIVVFYMHLVYTLLAQEGLKISA